MTAFDAARFNFYWYLWLLSPILFGVFAAFVETRLLRVVLFTSSMLAVYAFSNLAVWRKWELRLAGATSPDEVAAATADGGNLVFTLILGGPIEAVVLSAFFFWCARRIRNARL